MTTTARYYTTRGWQDREFVNRMQALSFIRRPIKRHARAGYLIHSDGTKEVVNTRGVVRDTKTVEGGEK
jgi:hypothetical protein